MVSAPSSNAGRSDPPTELGFALAARETDPFGKLTRSSEVIRVETDLCHGH